MMLRSCDDEVREGLVGSVQLRSDAAIGRREFAARDTRPELQAGLGKLRHDLVRHAIVELVDPFDVGTKADPPGQVQRDMGPKRTRHRNGIDQMTERRASRHRTIIALGKETWRQQRSIHAFYCSRRSMCAMARAVDDVAAVEHEASAFAVFETRFKSGTNSGS